MTEPLSAEGKVLHAALDEDEDQVKRLIQEFYPTELRALNEACALVRRVIFDIAHENAQKEIKS